MLLPLLGFVVNGALGAPLNQDSDRLGGLRRRSALAFGVALIAFFQLLSWHRTNSSPRATSSTTPGSTRASLKIDFGLLIDPLSAVMLLIVTGVGFLIHVYSVGYMHDDHGLSRASSPT